MKTYNIMLIVLLSILVISCKDAQDSHEYENINIELNDGQKWMVNSEMKPHILEAEQILLQYNDADFKELAQNLEGKNKDLIKSCTMDGKSHDELHKWLHPHIQLIAALDNAESKEEANKVIDDLKASFQTYHRYFQ